MTHIVIDSEAAANHFLQIPNHQRLLAKLNTVKLFFGFERICLGSHSLQEDFQKTDFSAKTNHFLNNQNHQLREQISQRPEHRGAFLHGQWTQFINTKVSSDNLNRFNML